LQANQANPPHAAIIGSPPAFHGSIQPGKNAEILLSKAFPNIALFVEKPISTSAMPYVLACSDFLKERKHIVSVGYMLRYLKCVQTMYCAIIAGD
jgi:predicted dehydrogenase